MFNLRWPLRSFPIARIGLGVALLWLVSLVFLLLTGLTATTAADTPKLKFDNPGFQKLWEYSDKVVDERGAEAGRGFTWGLASLSIRREHYEYQQIKGTERQVQYFDKGRLELNENAKEEGKVTAGLLVVELTSGAVQYGDNLFQKRLPAQVQVAGDENNAGGNEIAPTYASFNRLATFTAGQNRADDRTEQVIQQTINKQGQ